VTKSHVTSEILYFSPDNGTDHEKLCKPLTSCNKRLRVWCGMVWYNSQLFYSDHDVNSLLLLFLWHTIPSSTCCRLHVPIMESFYIPSDSPRSITGHLKPWNDVFLSHWASEDKAVMISEKNLTYHDGFIFQPFFLIYSFIGPFYYAKSKVVLFCICSFVHMILILFKHFVLILFKHFVYV
jgi:hypothetical protein